MRPLTSLSVDSKWSTSTLSPWMPTGWWRRFVVFRTSAWQPVSGLMMRPWTCSSGPNSTRFPQSSKEGIGPFLRAGYPAQSYPYGDCPGRLAPRGRAGADALARTVGFPPDYPPLGRYRWFASEIAHLGGGHRM